jgi:hypothetical protein
MASLHLLAPVQPILSNTRLRLLTGMALAALVSGCMTPSKNPFALGGVDPASPVAAEVREASASPGSFPKFQDIPAMPTDVRSAPAWKAAVLDETTLKRQTEAEAAAIPFTLAGTDAWATTTRARVQPQFSQQAPADARAQAEAFAAQAAARATPPPAPK